jgi:hypothetical protein
MKKRYTETEIAAWTVKQEEGRLGMNMKLFAVILFLFCALIVAIQFSIDSIVELEHDKQSCIDDVHNLEERLEFTTDRLFHCEDTVDLYNQLQLYWGENWRDIDPELQRLVKSLLCENYVCEEEK